jgi:peptidyl-prolyl cis-trans isomerase SurA
VRSEIASCVRQSAFAAAILAGAIFAATLTARAEEIVEIIDGQPITTLDMEHRAKFLQMSGKKSVTRKEVIDSLTDDILAVAEAKRYGLDISDARVDESYNTVAIRMGMDAQKLTQVLVASGASEATLKRRLRAQIASTKLARMHDKSPERSDVK